MPQENLVEILNIRKYFPIREHFAKVKRFVRAVDGVSFSVKKGEIFGLVGETGCGKTTIGRIILRLIKSDSGEIHFNGHNLTQVNDKFLRMVRRDMQIVFQDPYSTLNPRHTVKTILSEPLLFHKIVDKKQIPPSFSVQLKC